MFHTQTVKLLEIIAQRELCTIRQNHRILKMLFKLRSAMSQTASVLGNQLREIAANTIRLQEAFITEANTLNTNYVSLQVQLADVSAQLAIAIGNTNPDLVQAVTDVAAAMKQENDRSQSVLAGLLTPPPPVVDTPIPVDPAPAPTTEGAGSDPAESGLPPGSA